ncbi:MAG: hypothetical protein HFH55_06465 [Lachnospiraceae bacterium]|nr:hypothetical protein [Lachnospiraceae bacterium]
MRGRLYHAYSREGLKIANMEQLLFELEHFYDSIDFPHPSTNNRTFQGEIPHIGHRAGKEKVMSDEELLGRHGDLGTFIIRVQHRQNSSWQGRITWMDQDKTVYFRSMWEMLKLVDSALDTVSRWEDDRDEPTWPEESE